MTTDERDGYQQFQRKLSRQAFTVAVGVAVVLFVAGMKDVARGLLLGALFSVLNFAVLAYTLPMQVKRRRRTATGVAFMSLLLRMALLAVPLVLAVKLEMFHVGAVVVGLFAVPVGIFIDRCLIHGRYVRRM